MRCVEMYSPTQSCDSIGLGDETTVYGQRFLFSYPLIGNCCYHYCYNRYFHSYKSFISMMIILYLINQHWNADLSVVFDSQRRRKTTTGNTSTSQANLSQLTTTDWFLSLISFRILIHSHGEIVFNNTFRKLAEGICFPLHIRTHLSCKKVLG